MNQNVMRSPVVATAVLAATLLFGPLAPARASTDTAPLSDPTTMLPVIASPTAPAGDSEIKTRLSALGPLSIASEPLHVALLRRFYAGHGDQPVWATHPAQANALWHAVLKAGDQGLDPDRFHVAAFAKTALSPTDRELL